MATTELKQLINLVKLVLEPHEYTVKKLDFENRVIDFSEVPEKYRDMGSEALNTELEQLELKRKDLQNKMKEIRGDALKFMDEKGPVAPLKNFFVGGRTIQRGVVEVRAPSLTKLNSLIEQLSLFRDRKVMEELTQSFNRKDVKIVLDKQKNKVFVDLK